MAKRMGVVLVMAAVMMMFAANAGASLTDGLISYWNFDSASSTTATDSAGSNDGTIYGASPTTGGVIGSALSFDGVNDYVEIQNNNDLKSPLPVTISALIKMASTGTPQWIIGTDSRSAGYFGIWFYVSADNKLNVGYGDGGPKNLMQRRSKEGTTELMADTWYHVATVINGATDMVLYINAVNDQGTYSGLGGNLAYSSSGSSFIGSNSNVESYFNGQIDELRVYGRALSAAEVTELYLIPEPGTILLLGLGGLFLRKKR